MTCGPKQPFTSKKPWSSWPQPTAISAAALERYGEPDFWHRQPGFATLVLFILEQQVSLASGAAAFNRLRARVGEVTPDRPF